jgi:glycine/D-amino acid oxidase-like deaminating enzyme
MMDSASAADRSNFHRNAWLEEQPPQTPFACIDSDLKTDWLIVGAGFTGLAAAARLAELRPADRIVLIEAAKMGEGSGSRSSGFVVPLGHFAGSAKESASLFRLGLAGIDLLRQQVLNQAIDCEWSDTGRLIAARGAPGLRALRRIRRVLEQTGARFTPCSGRQIAHTTGMTGYLDGLRQDESIQVNPAKLQLGLIRSLPPNVELFEQSSVQALHRAQPWVAETACGRITAHRVLITNNANAYQLGVANHRVFPMQTFISVFQGTANKPACLGSESNWGLTSVERVGSSLRRVKDQLFLRTAAVCGLGDGTTSNAQLDAIVDLHRQAIARRFPHQSLECMKLWSGSIGISANGTQCFGQTDRELYYSVGYNGHGIAQGTISGQLLADLALQRDSELLRCLLSLPKPWWIPMPPLLYPIVESYVAWLNWRYRDEI